MCCVLCVYGVWSLEEVEEDRGSGPHGVRVVLYVSTDRRRRIKYHFSYFIVDCTNKHKTHKTHMPTLRRKVDPLH